jgi:lipoprotein-anchoring transpeptidase ErfK/SrfK
MFAGSVPSNTTSNNYEFSPINPGSYSLNLTGVPGVYFPAITTQVSPGVNLLSVVVFALKVFVLIATSNLSFNGTQPGPIITVRNNTAVRLVIHNNTTQIFNVAVVSSLYNTSTSNVLFNSLSSTVNAGGTLNDTFIVTKIGTFYYQSLIGNQAREGEYGYFTVIP